MPMAQESFRNQNINKLGGSENLVGLKMSSYQNDSLLLEYIQQINPTND